MKPQYKRYDTLPYVGMNLLEMLTQFHNKFGTPYDDAPRALSHAELAFRQVCHKEEANEYKEAVEKDPNNLFDQLDALADELYFLTGTCHRQGFNDSVACPPQYRGRAAFEIGYVARPLSAGTYALRFARHAHVLNAYERWAAQGDINGMALALNEAIRAVYATAEMHNFDIQEALLRVHAANMAKDVDPSKQRRTKELAAQGIDAGHMLEITKPDGWLPPYLGDLVGLGSLEEYQARQAAEEAEERALRNLRGLITIDGPDASGKSTLAARIAELTGGQVIHLTWSHELERVMDDYRTNAIGYAAALACDRVVILERPWLSHPVYATVYRGGKCNENHIHNWKLRTEHHALLNIIALPGCPDAWLENYQRMCEEREELHGPNPEKALAVYHAFRRAFQGELGSEWQPGNSGAPVEVFDMQQFTTVDIDGFIAQHVLPVLAPKE